MIVQDVCQLLDENKCHSITAAVDQVAEVRGVSPDGVFAALGSFRAGTDKVIPLSCQFLSASLTKFLLELRSYSHSWRELRKGIEAEAHE